jgi:hypothetical protein
MINHWPELQFSRVAVVAGPVQALSVTLRKVGYVQRSCLFQGASVPGPFAVGGGGMRPYVLPLVAGGGRLAPAPGGGNLEAVVDAQGAAVDAPPVIPPGPAFAQGARVEGMPPCGCELGIC